MFVLTPEEVEALRPQTATSKKGRGVRVVFDAIRDLLRAPEPPTRRIGFKRDEERSGHSSPKS